MAHSVEIELPINQVINKDVTFIIRRHDTKVGELRISKGGVDWYPAHAKRAVTKTWKQFARLFESA